MKRPAPSPAQRRRLAPSLAGVVCRPASRWLLPLMLLAAACSPVASAAALPNGALSNPVASSTGPATAVAVQISPAVTLAPTSLAGVQQPSTVADSQLGEIPDATSLPVFTATPTAQDKPQPTLGAFSITPLAGATLVTPNPTSLPEEAVESSIVNVLLIGTDSRPTDPSFRTDTLIVVSINKNAGTVSLLSIPRDLFVYIPMWGMARINRAFNAADRVGYPGGGPALLEQTILYNLGLPIQYYALVNFDGFRQVVDTLGGIKVPVNCQLTEYKIKDPSLDERVAANYDLFTQPVGVTHMDGALALWFARARPVGGDFYRGYRQRQVLRAMYHTALTANIIPEVPALYNSFREVVQTDMSLWDIMQFVPLTAHVDDAQIRTFLIGPNQTTGWVTPTGEEVLLPNGPAITALIHDFFADPATNQLAHPLTWVEVADGASSADEEALAAETLHNEGFAVRLGSPAGSPYAETVLVDYTTSAKGSPLKRLQSILHIDDAHVIPQPDPNSPVQFQVILGADYNPCPRLDWTDPTFTTGSAP